MVKRKKTANQEILDIKSGKSKPSVCSRRSSSIFIPSIGSNNNINTNNSNKNHNTKKKKTPTAAISTLNAINRADNSSKSQKHFRAQRRSLHIVNDNGNDDDYYQPISFIGVASPPILVPLIPVCAFRPVVQPASNTTTDVSIFVLSQVPKDMGFDNTIDKKTRELT